MEKNEVIIKKPSAMIQTSVKGLNLIQRKCVNALIHIAQNAGNQEIYFVSIKQIKDICLISSESNHELKQEIRKLQDIKIEYNYLKKENSVWGRTPLLGSVEIEEFSGILEFTFPPHLKNRVLNPSMYTPLNLVLIAYLSSSYTVILYEFFRDYQNSPKIPKLSIQQLRDLFGIDENKHKQFKYFRRDVLDRAITELNEKTDIHGVYELTKTGRRYSHIQFFVKKKEQKFQLPKEKLEIPISVVEAIPFAQRTSITYEVIREYCKTPINTDFLISNIRYSLRNAKSNFPHYLKKSLSADYACQEREEFQRKEELTHQKEMAKLKKQREIESKEQLGETLFNSLSLEDHLKYTEDVRVELKSLEISSQFITEELIKMKIIEKLLSEKRAERQGVQAGLF